jgi:predicted RNA-binding Zn ribbon-like protein
VPNGARRAARPQSAAGPSRTGAAPGGLEIVQRFVNTLDIEAGTDELDSPAALTAWLERHGLFAGLGRSTSPRPAAEQAPRDAPGVAVTAADLRRAVALREALRAVLRSHVPATAGGVAPGAVAEGGAAGRGGGAGRELPGIAAALRTRLEVSDDGLVAVVPAGSGASAALARILLIVAEAGSNGTWSRLKACSAADCQWAFYDRSPTRTGCWCSMRVCGSRSKSRAYRDRAAARTHTSPQGYNFRQSL